MRIFWAAPALAAVALCLSACGGGNEPSSSSVTGTSDSRTSPAPSSATPADATAVAARLKAGVKSVSKVVTITEDNDPNEKIGRPDGYMTAATLYDEGASCTELGADCGATIEVWPDEEAAAQRSKFILDALKEANGVLGSEYNYQDGPVLLRVAGTLKPSVAKQYETAFRD